MCQGLLAAVESRAEGRPVDAVGVRAGSLLRVEQDHFSEAFSMVAAGTVAADAQVELEIVPLEATCRDCGSGFTTDDPLPACPGCGSVALDRQGGDELTLVWLRYHGREGT